MKIKTRKRLDTLSAWLAYAALGVKGDVRDWDLLALLADRVHYGEVPQHAAAVELKDGSFLVMYAIVSVYSEETPDEYINVQMWHCTVEV